VIGWCDWIPTALIVIGAILIVYVIVKFLALLFLPFKSRRRNDSLKPFILGAILIAAGVMYGSQIAAYCKTLPLPDPWVKQQGLWLNIVFEDGTSKTVPYTPQLFVMIENKIPKYIEWHYKGDAKELKLWMFWNKPLTIGVTIWEQYVVPKEEVVYNMSYGELKSIIEKHAGSELLPSVTGQPFEMDINFGADVTKLDGSKETIKYDHALKLVVSYNELQQIVITAFKVSYAAQIIIPTQEIGGNGEVGVTTAGLATIIGAVAAVINAISGVYRVRR